MSFGIPVRNGLAIGLLSSTTLSSNGGLFPAMALDFLQPFLDTRVTFTRGSNATLVDRTGKITYAPANLLTRSEEFDNATWAKTNATVTANSTTAPNGTTTADTLIPSATLGSHNLLQTTSSTPQNNVLTVFAKPAGYNWIILQGSGFAWFDVANGVVGNQSGCTGSMTAVGNGWYRCQIYMTTSSANLNIWATNNNAVTSFTGDGTSGVFIWGAQLEPVTYQTTASTYVATTSAAYYGPRFDYDPVTLAAKGLLIEEARTNLATGSADFTATYWPVATNAVVTADNTTSPDGTNNADRLADNTTAGVQHRIYRDYTFTAASHTLSVFAKRNDHRWLRLFFFDGTTSFFGNFDLLNGVVGNKQASTTTTITAFGNGWYRCTMTATTAAAAGNIQLVMLPSDDTAVPVLYTGTGTSLWLFGAQLEAGSFATSYIPTVASQVTRSADVATMTGTNFSSWYNQTEGTFVLGGSIFANQGATTVDFLQASNGVSNAIAIDLGMFDLSAPFFGVSNTTSQANLDLGTLTLNSPFKMVGAYKVNDFAGAKDGGTVQTDTSGTVPSGIVQLGIGNRLSGPYMNGHIRTIAYYNTRLSNAQLQQLTAPSLVTTLSLDFINGVYNA